ncbi:MAG: DUF1957 domain-containing protein [Nitrospiraceae bacterium]|nr:DUF1957 domain-containing protein [Nitrospiraceae bacterium]
MKGFSLLFLHHHLPFIKHPEYSYFHEEHWLFEAISETYIPLLEKFFRLRDEGVNFRITISLTPSLCEMLVDPILKEKFRNYLKRTIELTEKEIGRTENSPQLNKLARFYNERFRRIEAFYDSFGGNLLKAYAQLESEGFIEIVTCGATHGLLPVLQPVEEAVEAQIRVAVKNFKKHFGKKPKGIWLPECGYYPEVERHLKANGIEFFFLDSHGILYGLPFPRFGVYSPVRTPKGMYALARDPESSRQVWSAKEGYPGDPWYRDFYRDIGFDLPLEYIKPYINPDGRRTYTGIKYYRVTGNVDLGSKKLYVREKALEKARAHARHFHFCRDKQADYLKGVLGREPLIVSPFDAELFGHWWFEGPEFLYYMFKEIENHKVIKPIFLKEYLSLYPENPLCQPSTSSWGDRRYFDVWVNGGNDWVYYYLIGMAKTLNRLKGSVKRNERNTRILNQMLRELLLAQSSDWTFLITMGTASSYAERRLKGHISNFEELRRMVEGGRFDEEKLRRIEGRDSIFQEISFWEDWVDLRC